MCARIWLYTNSSLNVMSFFYSQDDIILFKFIFKIYTKVDTLERSLSQALVLQSHIYLNLKFINIKIISLCIRGKCSLKLYMFRN